jgi:DNA primase
MSGLLDAHLDRLRSDGHLLRSIVSLQVTLKRAGRGWKGCCPFHDERTPSFYVYSDGHYHCFGCREHGTVFDYVMKTERVEFPEAARRVVAKVAISAIKPQKNGNSDHQGQSHKVAAAYDYHDQNGALAYQVVRMVPKTFRQRRPDGAGGWTWNMSGVERVLYRLPELLRAAPDATVFITEGEKDVDALRERCLVATTNPGGAGKWQPGMSEYLRGRHVVILPDNDEAGEKHTNDVAAMLQGVARSIHILRLPGCSRRATYRTGSPQEARQRS